MATTSASAIQRVARPNTGLRIIAVVFGLFWAALGISPLNRVGWLLEHTPTLIGVTILVRTYRTVPLSNTSYLLIGFFAALHSIGAHYGYAEVPAGHWTRETFGLERNHYDRVVHFAFGFLLAFPVREFLIKATTLRQTWTYYLPVEVIVATSGIYEVLEMFVAMTIRPDMGVLYLGAQGDAWDAQKDIGMAAIGSVLMMTLVACGRAWRKGSLGAFR
jgi:putative membrane protein